MHIMPGVLGPDKRISGSAGGRKHKVHRRIRLSIFVSPSSSRQPGLTARKQFNLFATVKIQRQQTSFFPTGEGVRRGGVGGERREKEVATAEGRNQKGLTQTFLPHFNLLPSTISIIFQPEIQEDIFISAASPTSQLFQALSPSSPPPPAPAQQLPIVRGREFLKSRADEPT